MFQEFHLWEYYMQKNWKRVLHRYLYICIHESIIQYSQKAEATQISINQWKEDQM